MQHGSSSGRNGGNGDVGRCGDSFEGGDGGEGCCGGGVVVVVGWSSQQLEMQSVKALEGGITWADEVGTLLSMI